LVTNLASISSSSQSLEPATSQEKGHSALIASGLRPLARGLWSAARGAAPRPGWTTGVSFEILLRLRGEGVQAVGVEAREEDVAPVIGAGAVDADRLLYGKVVAGVAVSDALNEIPPNLNRPQILDCGVEG